MCEYTKTACTGFSKGAHGGRQELKAKCVLYIHYDTVNTTECHQSLTAVRSEQSDVLEPSMGSKPVTQNVM